MDSTAAPLQKLIEQFARLPDKFLQRRTLRSILLGRRCVGAHPIFCSGHFGDSSL